MIIAPHTANIKCFIFILNKKRIIHLIIIENGCKIKKNNPKTLQNSKFFVSLPPEIVGGRIFATTFSSTWGCLDLTAGRDGT
jgi:hypothetical protein